MNTWIENTQKLINYSNKELTMVNAFPRVPMAQINKFEYKKRYLHKNWIITGERNQLADKSFKKLTDK